MQCLIAAVSRFWDVRSGKCTNMLNMAASGSVSLAWNTEGTSLAVANNKEDTITFVDTRKNKVIKTVRLSTNVSEGSRATWAAVCAAVGSVVAPPLACRQLHPYSLQLELCLPCLDKHLNISSDVHLR